ncbi:MAG TPA: AlpA family phage regulatory protein [Rickettsiales bacterium]|nr:AlpA family phage regulatory protein [Rickettsiales bacterium]
MNKCKLLQTTSFLLQLTAHANSLPVTGQLFLSASQVAVRIGLSRTTLWRLLKNDPTFPKPVRFGKQTRRWSLPEIEAYLAASRTN